MWVFYRPASDEGVFRKRGAGRCGAGFVAERPDRSVAAPGSDPRGGDGWSGWRAIKRKVKGIWWMPWHQEAMKDVALCEKPRGDESNL